MRQLPPQRVKVISLEGFVSSDGFLGSAMVVRWETGRLVSTEVVSIMFYRPIYDRAFPVEYKTLLTDAEIAMLIYLKHVKQKGHTFKLLEDNSVLELDAVRRTLECDPSAVAIMHRLVLWSDRTSIETTSIETISLMGTTLPDSPKEVRHLPLRRQLRLREQ